MKKIRQGEEVERYAQRLKPVEFHPDMALTPDAENYNHQFIPDSEYTQDANNYDPSIDSFPGEVVYISCNNCTHQYYTDEAWKKE